MPLPSRSTHRRCADSNLDRSPQLVWTPAPLQRAAGSVERRESSGDPLPTPIDVRYLPRCPVRPPVWPVELTCRLCLCRVALLLLVLLLAARLQTCTASEPATIVLAAATPTRSGGWAERRGRGGRGGGSSAGQDRGGALALFTPATSWLHRQQARSGRRWDDTQGPSSPSLATFTRGPGSIICVSISMDHRVRCMASDSKHRDRSQPDHHPRPGSMSSHVAWAGRAD